MQERVCQAVDEVVARQTEAGIDIVNDGECGQPSYALLQLRADASLNGAFVLCPRAIEEACFIEYDVNLTPPAASVRFMISPTTKNCTGCGERRRLFCAARPESSSAAMTDRSDHATLRGASSRRRAIPAKWNPMSTIQHTQSFANAGPSGGFERSVCSPSLTAWQRDGVRFLATGGLVCIDAQPTLPPPSSPRSH